MTRIYTIDGKIVNAIPVVLEIVAAIQAGTEVKLDTMSEGPCCEQNGTYALLDRVTAQFNYPKSRVTIVTANMLEQHSEYNIVHQFNYWELVRAIANHKEFPFAPKRFDQDFRHFGHFIGHGNKYRLLLGSYLYTHQQSKTLQSYHCRVQETYHREFLGIEDLLFYQGHSSSVDQAFDFLKHTPLTLDPIESYPILQPANIGISSYYKHFFLEIVNLTYFSGNVFYVDEKIWRPMLNLTPFLVQGPSNTVKNIRRLGFQTFDQWWDEGYSEDPDDCQVAPMIKVIEQLSRMSDTQLETMYNEMLPVLYHNRDLALSITEQEITKAFYG